MNAFACARKLFDGGSEDHARMQFISASATELQAPSVRINSRTIPPRTSSHLSRAAIRHDPRYCVYCCSRDWPEAAADAATVYCLRA